MPPQRYSTPRSRSHITIRPLVRTTTPPKQHDTTTTQTHARDKQVDKCFGFDTAVEEAQHALLAAKVEARSGYKGLGLVKLMGRHSGFIAMQASMASGAWLVVSPSCVC